MRAVLSALVILSGCAAVPVMTRSQEDEVEVSPPGEDGTRYVAIRSGRQTAPRMLERKWTKLASEACQGDYMLMSDGASEQTRAGVVVARVHEGFVRCLLPEAAEGMDKVDAQAREAAERRVDS